MSAPPARTRAVVYLRQSFDRTRDAFAVTRQLEAARKLVAARNWNLVAEYVENDISAKGDREREYFLAVLRHLNERTADVIVGERVDRFTRNARDTLAFLEAGEKAGALLACTAGSDMDLATADGRTMAAVLAAFAQGEIDKKAERQKAASAHRASQGKPHAGGRRAFGYEPDGLTLRPVEADALRQAYQDVLAQAPLSRIAARLNDAGLYTPQSPRSREGEPSRKGEPSPWTGQTLRATLLNPRYAGIRAVGVGTGNQKVYDEITAAKWPAVVDEDTFRGVCAILNDPSRVSLNSVPYRLLTSIASCFCGAHVNGGAARPKAGGHITYRCSARPGHLARAALPVDEFVAAAVVAHLSGQDMAELFAESDRPDAGALSIRRKALQGRLDQLAVDYADGEIDRSQMRAGTDRLRQKIAEIDTELLRASQTAALAAFAGTRPAAQVWAALDLDQRRATIRATRVQITLYQVGRGTRTFRPETVKLVWPG